MGVVPGFAGPVAIVAGRENAVREQGIAALDKHWKLDVDSRAELVVVGIGGPGVDSTIDDLAEGLARACSLVQRGGKIVALSQVEGSIGPRSSGWCRSKTPSREQPPCGAMKRMTISWPPTVWLVPSPGRMCSF